MDGAVGRVRGKRRVRDGVDQVFRVEAGVGDGGEQSFGRGILLGHAVVGRVEGCRRLSEREFQA